MPTIPIPVPPETKELYIKIHQAIALALPAIGRDFDIRIRPDETGGLKARLIPKNELGFIFCEYLTKNFETYFNNPVEDFKLEEELI